MCPRGRVIQAVGAVPEIFSTGSVPQFPRKPPQSYSPAKKNPGDSAPSLSDVRWAANIDR